MKKEEIHYFNHQDTSHALFFIQGNGNFSTRVAGYRHKSGRGVIRNILCTESKKKRSQNVKLKLFKLKVGDYVRISHLKTVFTRPYDQTYSGEVFRVQRRYYRGTLPLYRLRDLQNEDIKGTFYQSEYNPNSAFKIERILKTKGKGANKQYFVKWKYYPKEV
ncbi:hypothetical protein MAR_030910 [Mya arenaria]|uniref:Chromo domain-containing protein n=1 Tax=Mya arenaria TaxID=6604 RepID=A0ABY7FAG6_MYAAR|nr:hypothetical protein MAR_030910 [Mya arenaria]